MASGKYFPILYIWLLHHYCERQEFTQHEWACYVLGTLTRWCSWTSKPWICLQCHYCPGSNFLPLHWLLQVLHCFLCFHELHRSFQVNVSPTRVAANGGQGMCPSAPCSSASGPQQVLLCTEQTNDFGRKIRANQWSHHWLILWMTAFAATRMEENLSPSSCFPDTNHVRTFVIPTVSYSLLFFLLLFSTFPFPSAFCSQRPKLEDQWGNWLL